ncbi:MAG: ABC transporter ATP-binding protein [Promethearchaeota archaeon]
MKRVHLTRKFMKPYYPIVGVAILLLFTQAYCSLSLPNYMSDIVNTGIQQGGVDSAVPLAVRNSTMSHMQIFMTPANQTDVLDHYSFVNTSEPTSPSYQKYIDKYPALVNESIFVRNNMNQSEISRLNPIIGRAIIPVGFITMMQANSTMASQMYFAAGFNSTQVAYLLTLSLDELFPALAGYPAELAQLTAMINARLSFGESLIVQLASGVIIMEYEALGMDLLKLQNDYILGVGGLMLLLTLLSMAATITVSFLAAKVSTGMARDIRKDLFEKVENFSNAEFDEFSTASLITRSTNDITQIQTVIFMVIRIVIYAPIIGVGGIMLALSTASDLWWIILISVLLMLAIVLFIFYIAVPKFKKIQKLVDKLNLVAREGLTGMMVIRAFNREKFEEARFERANVNLTSISRFVNRLMVVMMPVMMFVMNTITVGIAWIGSNQVGDGTMQVGDMMAFMQYVIQIVFAFLMMSMMFVFMPRASVSASRIVDVLSTESTIIDSDTPKKFTDTFKGDVEFKNVSFRYPGAKADVLSDISFTAKAGQTTAIIGATGAGKSTIVNLILRFYDANSGSITIDDVDIRDVTQHDLREKIGYVPQKSVLFSGTIESNLLYADDGASKDTLESAIDIAQASEFISSKKGGMMMEIAQGGMNVSGGQKQRLSIARAIVKKPPIYILDDSFSALDFKTDAALRRAFKKHSGESTLIIVTQRVSTIKNAEQIIVVDQGKIVSKGTHGELMESCEIYNEIARSQLSMEELQ